VRIITCCLQRVVGVLMGSPNLRGEWFIYARGVCTHRFCKKGFLGTEFSEYLECIKLIWMWKLHRIVVVFLGLGFNASHTHHEDPDTSHKFAAIEITIILLESAHDFLISVPEFTFTQHLGVLAIMLFELHW
jgi:hypothetical protein